MKYRLDGNSVLLIESDKDQNALTTAFIAAGAQVTSVSSIASAIKALEVNEFDVIISDYYLPDGLIHHVVDWSREHLDSLPIFIARGSSMPADEALLHRHLISCVFPKGAEPDTVIRGVQGFLFDFNKFYQSLLSMVNPRGISLEIIVQKEKHHAVPIEMTKDGIFVSLDERFEKGTFGLLRICLFDSDAVENFTLVGSLGGKFHGGQHFKINESYAHIWQRLQTKLSERQMSITGFLGKVAGK